MDGMFIARCLLALCALGVITASLGWWLTSLQAQRWERARQEVRERLAGVEYVPEPVDIVVCERHNTVSPSYCSPCLIEELVAPDEIRRGRRIIGDPDFRRVGPKAHRDLNSDARVAWMEATFCHQVIERHDAPDFHVRFASQGPREGSRHIRQAAGGGERVDLAGRVHDFHSVFQSLEPGLASFSNPWKVNFIHAQFRFAAWLPLLYNRNDS